MAHDGQGGPARAADAASAPSGPVGANDLLVVMVDGIAAAAATANPCIITVVVVVVGRETADELRLVEADVQVRVQLLDHPGEGRVDEPLDAVVVDPAEVAVVAGEVDLAHAGAAHQGRSEGAAGFVQGETVEGELDVWRRKNGQ